MANRLTWDQRADRRRQMALEVTADPDSVGKVAAKFRVSTETVRRACKTYAPKKLARHSEAFRKPSLAGSQ